MYWKTSEPEWDPEYDSTWEDQDEKKDRTQKANQPSYRFYSRSSRAARDLQNYRHEYPDLRDCGSEMPNLQFYLNKKRFEPNGILIEDLLEEWKDDYEMLEDNHSYIQWLFPLRESGMNWRAKPLTKNEITEMRKYDEVLHRFINAYKLMLGFYGITLENEETGQVKRADNWEERFENLNCHSHNNLRITRILKCLGEMGFEHFQAPLVQFFLDEALDFKTLDSVKYSVLDYFIFTVKNKMKRRELVYHAWTLFQPSDKFVWGPINKLKTYKKGKEDEIKVSDKSKTESEQYTTNAMPSEENANGSHDPDRQEMQEGGNASSQPEEMYTNSLTTTEKNSSLHHNKISSDSGNLEASQKMNNHVNIRTIEEKSENTDNKQQDFTAIEQVAQPEVPIEDEGEINSNRSDKTESENLHPEQIKEEIAKLGGDVEMIDSQNANENSLKANDSQNNSGTVTETEI
ncbi:opioid growth factor receptor [Bombina bombina]|uniref:opioid growth factor receptor n=1 Tax=Bombina bombina TaxID=8345 RepID=UPI00235A84DC|nr:opioid growth factor receptor [Bombina bombina]